MAIFPYKNQAAECGVKDLYLAFAVGASGAVGAFTRRQGFTNGSPAAAVLGTTGVYTLNLDQRWQALMDAQGKIIGAVAVADGVQMEVTSVNLNQAQPTVVVTWRRTDTGAAANPPNGSVCNIHLQLKDSTV
jgi:hypothetical protein